MGKIYDPCPPPVHERVAKLVGLHYSDLLKAGVRFDLLFISRDDEDESAKPVLTLHGCPALALARIVPAKERAKGCADAEIVIDRDRFTGCSEESQDALLDHELCHFLVVKKDGEIQMDEQQRPRLKLRHHDYEFGWFECVARRYGMASVEVQQAKRMYDANRQSLFPFLEEVLTTDLRG